jgi:hypothetical protein
MCFYFIYYNMICYLSSWLSLSPYSAPALRLVDGSTSNQNSTIPPLLQASAIPRDITQPPDWMMTLSDNPIENPQSLCFCKCLCTNMWHNPGSSLVDTSSQNPINTRLLQVSVQKHILSTSDWSMALLDRPIKIRKPLAFASVCALPCDLIQPPHWLTLLLDHPIKIPQSPCFCKCLCTT